MKKMILLFPMIILSCSPEKSETTSSVMFQDSVSVNYIQKEPGNNTMAKVGEDLISREELENGIEVELFELEEKIFNLKMDRLKVILLERFMNKHPKKVGLTNDQFFEKVIAPRVSPSKKQIEDFIKSRGITPEQLNADLMPRIESYLREDNKKKALDRWLDEQTAKNKVEIYFEKPTRPIFEVKVGDAPYMGKNDAKITIVSYSDYQCPFSKKGSEILKEIRDLYGENVKIVHKDFPLPFHSKAKAMAEAALCVNDQNPKSFWKFYFGLYENQENSSTEKIKEFSKKVGLNYQQLIDCLNSKKFNSKIEEEISEAVKIGVKSTPTFFINGKVVNGAHNIEVFKSIIDEEMRLNKKNI